MMKNRVFAFLAVLMIAVGVIWFFQGIGVLPGSFMTGDPLWTWVGGIVFVLGLGLFFISQRTQRGGDSNAEE
jgi:hypothetical protein